MNVDMTIVWMALLLLCLVIEMLTLSLTTIWFAAGAFVSLILTQFDVSTSIQFVVFIAVSVLILFLLRPSAVRYFNSKREKTNANGLIGKEAKVVETVNNKENTGTAIVNGQEWTARAKDDNMVIEVDTWAEIVEITGVKLILNVNKEDKK